MRFVICLLMVSFLTACTIKPKVNVNSMATPENLPNNWTLDGRLALKTPEEKFSASLDWQQTNSVYQLRLSKLIGGTVLLIHNDEEGLVSMEFDGQTYRDSNAERLLWRVTGWSIPVNDFQFWVSGQLNPASPAPVAVKKDEQNRLWSFETKDGWRVQYQNYKVFSGKPMPHNMTIEKDTTQNQTMQLKLRISDWEFE